VRSLLPAVSMSNWTDHSTMYEERVQVKYHRIVITGGCGFLGQFVVRQLLQTDDRPRLRVIDLKANRAAVFDFTDDRNVETVLGVDVCDYDSIAGEFTGADCVIHLAGVVSFSLKDEALLGRVNVDGTRNVLRAAGDNGVRTVIHVSSVAALGYADDKDKPVDEDFRFDWNIAKKRRKFYMLSKHRADLEAAEFRRRGLNVAVVYPGLMFGPGDVANSARLIKAISRRRIPFNMPGGTNIVDVRDVAAAIAGIVRQGIDHGDYLLSGWNLTFKEINRAIAEALATKPPAVTLPRFLNGPLFALLLMVESMSRNKLELTADNLDSAFKFRYFDNGRARKDLGWQPQIGFRQTIQDTIEWMKNDGQLD